MNEKCNAPSVFSEEQEVALENIDRFQCIFNVLYELSSENGMFKEWGKVQGVIQNHFTAWRECSSAGNDEDVQS